MEKQNPKKPANPIQLRSLGWVDEELAMVQDQYSATLSAINFPCYTQSSSKTKDYQVVVDGKDYGLSSAGTRVSPIKKKHERPVIGTLPNDKRPPLWPGRAMMIYAGQKRKATEAQIRLILKLTDQSDLNNVKNLENCPPVVRYKEDLNKKYLDNRTAAKIIDGLIQWKEIYG